MDGIKNTQGVACDNVGKRVAPEAIPAMYEGEDRAADILNIKGQSWLEKSYKDIMNHIEVMNREGHRRVYLNTPLHPDVELRLIDEGFEVTIPPLFYAGATPYKCKIQW